MRCSNGIKAGLTWIWYVLVGLVVSVGLALPGSTQTAGLFPSIEGSPGLDIGPSQVEAASTQGNLTQGNLSDRQDLEAFIDNVFFQEIESNSAPGGAIAIVQGGEILLAKGYGYADLDQQRPVEADTTLFRVASISKMFTATAIMQLYEQGKLNTDDPVSTYLGNAVELENPFEEAVTVEHLLTQTDGSTKRRIGLAADTEARLQPLEEYLGDHMPPVVHPPGELFNYSSHTFALLGYLVQRISNQPFVEYMADHILQPLEMSRSSFAQPPPYRDALATGYRKAGNQFKPVPYLYLNIGPGAALSSTATDIAHFMIAHLQGGAYRDSRILQPETVAAMQRIRFRPHPELPGTGYTFRERRINNVDTIGHLGSLRGYSSSLTLIPNQNIGIFVVSNSLSGIHGRVLRQFFDRYFPAEAAADTTVAASDADTPISGELETDLDKFTGTYWDLEYPHHTLTKLSAPFQQIRIQRHEGGLRIETPSLFFRNPHQPVDLVPIGPQLFRHQDSETLTAFDTDADGNVTYAYNPIFPKMATYTKIAWYETVWLHVGIIGAAVLLFVSSIWVWPIHPTLRRLQGKPFSMAVPTPLAWATAGLTSALNLIFLIGFPLALFLYGGWRLAYGMPWFGYAFLTLPMVSALLTLGMVGFALWSWWKTEWYFAGRLHYTLLTLAAVLFTALLAYWNFLGFQF